MTRPARLLFELRFAIGSLVFFAGSGVFNLLCLGVIALGCGRPLQRFLRAALHRMFRFWFWLLGALDLVHVDARDRQRIGRERGVIYVANHPTVIDAPVLLALAPDCVCVYKEKLNTHPFYGAVARAVGFLPNTGGPDLVREATEALQRGSNLLIFPEGTRSSMANPSAWKGGFALIAKRAQAPICPLWIDAPRNFLDRPGTLWAHRTKLPITMRVEALERREVAPNASVAEAMNEVARAFESRQNGSLP